MITQTSGCCVRGASTVGLSSIPKKHFPYTTLSRTADAHQARFFSEVRLVPQGPIPVKCYCGFECATEGELKEHIIKTHGARDGDWKGWVSH